ncbi:unnamed protein product [Acanthosepion pharaonis]|uniref:Uncharacterized protein n=1 Tax=Acanthosepion pharaonis TaxID=158019 RepID=A0A812AZL5_ACAPH|nr:unnamed protein product [Sepia pharaonis]
MRCREFRGNYRQRIVVIISPSNPPHPQEKQMLAGGERIYIVFLVFVCFFPIVSPFLCITSSILFIHKSPFFPLYNPLSRLLYTLSSLLLLFLILLLVSFLVYWLPQLLSPLPNPLSSPIYLPFSYLFNASPSYTIIFVSFIAFPYFFVLCFNIYLHCLSTFLLSEPFFLLNANFFTVSLHFFCFIISPFFLCVFVRPSLSKLFFYILFQHYFL